MPTVRFSARRDSRYPAADLLLPEATFTRGAGNLCNSAAVEVSAHRRLPKPPVPEWFVRMDRNGDGDVTLQTLGEEEQFKKLDANGDGFIELKEAEAAK